MTTLTVLLLGVALLSAIGDWIGVATDRQQWVHAFKPAVMVLAIGATLSLQDIATPLRILVVVAQVAGLVGDVALMKDKFLPGAAAFGVGHILYIIAWLPYARPGWPLGAAVIVMAIVIATIGRRVVTGCAQRSGTLAQAVAIYQMLLALMVVVACGTENPVLAGAAVLFAASDTLLGWSRFVHENPRLRVVVHVMFHVAQLGIVVALPMLTRP